MTLSQVELSEWGASRQKWNQALNETKSDMTTSPPGSNAPNASSTRFDSGPHGRQGVARRALWRWLPGLAFLTGGLAILVGVFASGGEAEWDPLGDSYPVQDVLVRAVDSNGQPILDGGGGQVWSAPVETVSINVRGQGFVPVAGTKCRGPSDSIQVEGSSQWRRSQPPGFATEVAHFLPVVQPGGCSAEIFENVIPLAVIEIVCRDGAGLWAIVGEETPVGEAAADGSATQRSGGVSRPWETKLFELTCGLG